MSAFGIVDYIIFIGTLAVSMLIGVYYAFIKKQTTNEELLVGGRQMAILPSALSLLATYMSAILVLGFAGEIYANGTLIAIMALAALFFIPLGGFLFMPTLYGLKLTSAYEVTEERIKYVTFTCLAMYLELRFESRAVRLIATLTFITQIVLYSGVVLFAPSLALNAVVPEFPIWASIVSVGGVAAIYTSIGGIKMMFAGLFAIIIKGSTQVGGFGKVIEIVGDHDRFEFFNFKFDPFTRHTTLNLIFGQGIFWLSAYGCHQTTVQRYCSMSSLKRAFTAHPLRDTCTFFWCIFFPLDSWLTQKGQFVEILHVHVRFGIAITSDIRHKALILTSPLVVFTMMLAILSGLVIFANYAGCDPITLGLIKRPDQISPHFVLEFLSPTSGLLGLFISCLFSGALSTISSALNSLVAVTYEDFFKTVPRFRNMSETRQGLVVKLIGVAYGVVVIIMGFISGNLGGVLSAALVVNGSVSGPLLGVFVLGVLMPFINKKGAIIGMLVGHVVTLWISVGSLLMARKVPTLPFRIDGCAEEIWTTVNRTAALIRQEQSVLPPLELDFPDKIYTVSYALYPLIGLLVTVIVASIVSLLTGPTKLTKGQEQYTHPWIVKLYKICRKAFRTSEFEMDSKPPEPKIIVNGMQINMSNSVIPSRRRSTGSRGKPSSMEAYENPGFQRS